MGRNSGGISGGGNNSVESVLNHKFGDVPLTTNAAAYLEFGKKNMSKTYNAKAREYGGLTQTEYAAQVKKYKAIKNKGGVMSPQDVNDSIQISKRMIEHTQYEMKKEKSIIARHSKSSMIASMANNVHQLNDWFDTSKNKPKYFNKQWKNYYNKNKNKFK